MSQYKYFKLKEFDCNCCKIEFMSHEFIMQLDHARELAKVPFVINSGYRCKEKQRKLYEKGISSKKRSSHQKGIACDIKATSSRSRSAILYGLISAGFNRIGIGKTWVHVDKDPLKARSVTWLY
tara:strand:+ start:592 stop:963 length:372 start_codon:yes stop_codon:yes gene_type:complete